MRSLVGFEKTGALILLAVSMLAWTTTPALAQDDGEDETKAAKLRSEMYETLAREGAGIERQSNVLKTVVNGARTSAYNRWGYYDDLDDGLSGEVTSAVAAAVPPPSVATGSSTSWWKTIRLANGSSTATSRPQGIVSTPGRA